MLVWLKPTGVALAKFHCRYSLWPSGLTFIYLFFFRGEYGLEQYSEVKTVSDKF